MASIKFFLAVCLCLATVALSAPTESPAGQANETTTTLAPSDSPAGQANESTPVTLAPVASTPDATNQTSAEAPATDGSNANTTSTASMTPVSSSVHDHRPFNTTSFTCYGRSIGYYADVEHDCKVYHFCLLGDYNGDVIYQRISYLCLKDTVFDQQALDCVEPTKMSSPCPQATMYFDSSNAILRQAIVGGASNGGALNDSGSSQHHSADHQPNPAPTGQP